MIKYVIKRSDDRQPFRPFNVRRAIEKANAEVPIEEQATDEEIQAIISNLKKYGGEEMHVEAIQDFVQTSLMQYKHFELAGKYIAYRQVRALARQFNQTYHSILALLDGSNKELLSENSNKNGYTNSTQRDLMAGEVSKSIADQFILPPDILEDHLTCKIHYHDRDYAAQKMFNCFRRDTRFITSTGTYSFKDFEDGDEVLVPDKNGDLQKATIHKYGVQKLNRVRFRRGKSSVKEVYCTYNHTWYLYNDTKTNNLSEGDRILLPPLLDDFDFYNLSDSAKVYWCLGFALGDGTDYDNTKYGQSGSGIRIRLCGNKSDFANYFADAGFSVTYPDSYNSDASVIMTGYSKVDFLNSKNWLNLDRECKIALFNGYISSDGEFRNKEYATGISTINSNIEALVYDLAEMSGYYIGASRVVTGATNFCSERTPLRHIQFTRSFYCKQPWIVDSIEETDLEEEVWCLEVENTHSFILSNGLVTGNCCLINIKDMLDNGSVMNNTLIESPRSFRTACNVMTQFVANIASNQYGGQSVAIKHLGRYLAISRDKIRMRMKKRLDDTGIKYTEDQLNRVVEDMLQEELKDGVQLIQYQCISLMTTNGQSPFITLFLQIDDEDPYKNEVAMIVREIIRQRYEGIKNKDGVYVTPTFPKLVYVLDENTIEGGEFYDITQLCAKCNIKRSYPDYISAKKMRELHDGEVYSCMGCRSFLSEWKITPEYAKENGLPDSEIGKYKWEGRFNQGVVSINLPQIGIEADHDMDKFWLLLEDRLMRAHRALLFRHSFLEGTLSNSSPLHWQFGAIARLKVDEPIDKLLHGGYSTISLGYIGIYETVQAMLGVSHTTDEGSKFALKIMKRLKGACDQWKEETGIGFGLYGTPAESLCYRFAKYDTEHYGVIKNVTDHDFYTNSYHVFVGERINAFEKFAFESQFQSISTGGCISYVEIPNLESNVDAVLQLINYIYDTIMYAEFNSKSDYCYVCGYDGEIKVNQDNEWECPCCHNKDQNKMIVTRRTCGYLGANFWNPGKTKEISQRVTHL